LLVVSSFVGFIALASYESYHSYKFPWLIQKMLVRATWIAVSLYVIIFFLFEGGLAMLQNPEDASQDRIMGPRSLAAFALLGLAWYLSAWRYGSRHGLWWAIVITAMIGLTLSRTALIVALIMFPLSMIQLRSVRGWVRASLAIVFIGGVAYFAVMNIEPLYARFFVGDVALQVGETVINTAGRTEIWEVVLNSYAESPVVGKGAGSGDELTMSHFDSAGHAHNEYLRILHDYGLIGAGLWLLGYISLLGAVWRTWQKADRTADVEAPLHFAAFLSLVAVALVMITDNVAIYIFIMAPLGALVGASLGRTRYY
jgi:O-antigen ligase